MSCTANQSGPIQIISPCELRTMFVSFELSKRKWLLTLLSPGSDKMSKYTVAGGDWNTLIALLKQAKEKAEVRIRQPVRIIAIHEAGLDGFSVHRMLEKNGVESHVVDAASVAVPRRKRRAKSDRIDGETLMRTLMAWKRGEPRVCSMVVPPSPEDEDRRRLSRERQTLITERIQHTNRIRGMLMAEGIADYDPLRRDRRERLDALRTPDGRAVPRNLKARIVREIERIEVLMRQIGEIEAERGALLRTKQEVGAEAVPGTCRENPAVMLMRLKGKAPSSPPCSGSKPSSDASAIIASSQPMSAWHPLPGRVARSIVNRASRKRGTHVCGRSVLNSHGCGCSTSRTRP